MISGTDIFFIAHGRKKKNIMEWFIVSFGEIMLIAIYHKWVNAICLSLEHSKWILYLLFTYMLIKCLWPAVTNQHWQSLYSSLNYCRMSVVREEYDCST